VLPNGEEPINVATVVVTKPPKIATFHRRSLVASDLIMLDATSADTRRIVLWIA
jgi:hypothetical protein